MKKTERFKVDPETLEVYRSMLPYGAQKEIAKQIGVSPQSVTMFIRGKSSSKRIEDAVIDYIVELRQERQAKLRKAGLL